MIIKITLSSKSLTTHFNLLYLTIFSHLNTTICFVDPRTRCTRCITQAIQRKHIRRRISWIVHSKQNEQETQTKHIIG